MKFIPVNLPLLDGNEKKYLNECIDTGWISSEGPFVKKFEENFSNFLGRKYGIAVSSGTAALDIAVKSLKIGEGDEVLVPCFTIISCVSAIIRAGAKPVLLDSDFLTWNIDISQIEKKITKKTKAIMVVHTYGLPVEMNKILQLSKKYKLKIIEDAAEMHGQTYNGKLCGSFGDISIFSFYPNKHITTGEGGMILTNNSSISKRCRSLRNLAFQEKKRFIHNELGWNYRMTNIQAALGLSQLKNIKQVVKKKMEIGNQYFQRLNKNKNIQILAPSNAHSKNIYWVVGILVKNKKINIKKVTDKLLSLGIQTRPFFWPMHKQPVFQKMGLFKNESYPVAENLSKKGIYVPSGLAITKTDIFYVSKWINKIIS